VWCIPGEHRTFEMVLLDGGPDECLQKRAECSSDKKKSGMVTYACNPGYLGGVGRSIMV
jgi:hypothetical protein